MGFDQITMPLKRSGQTGKFLLASLGTHRWLIRWGLKEDDSTSVEMCSDFLFAHPSPLYGAARLFDLGALLDSYNESLTPSQADELALRSDWCMVGQDLRAALERAVQEYLESEHGEALLEYIEKHRDEVIEHLESLSAGKNPAEDLKESLRKTDR